MIDIRQAHALEKLAEVDVLVVGGGPAGTAAGFAAARMGARTLIVEQFNCLGGVAGAGGHGHICLFSSYGTDERVVGGIPFETVRRVADAGYGVYNNRESDFEVEGYKLVLERMAEECGCGLRYHTFFCDAVVEQGMVVGAVVQSKNGRQWIRAKRIVDASGDGDVAALAGCGFGLGAPDSGHCQPMTLMFTIGGVDIKRLGAFRQTLGPDAYSMCSVWKCAQEAGDMRPFQSRVMGTWWTPTRPDQLGINFTHINYVSALDAGDLTRATIEGRRQAYESIEVFRKYVPGLENCYMVSTPNTVGIRESRRIRGRYTLTRADVANQSEFADTIGYGSFFIDIHNVTGPGMDTRTYRPDPGFKYQIPWRICVPQGADNLLVAGRCASADHEALGSLRVMPQCGVMGEACGTAAALSIERKVTSASLPVDVLQDALRARDCILNQNDIEATE